MSDITQAILANIKKMPRVSTVTSDLLLMLSNDKYSVNEISKIIESDISLTTRCLQIVNSSFFGLKGQIRSIRNAVSFLGRLNLISIVLSDGMKNIFSVSLKSYASSSEDFWKHCLKAAISSKVLSWHLSPGIQTDLAYTAGLLHDIGKAVISEYLEKSSLTSGELLIFNNNEDLVEQEQKSLSTDHTIIGEAVAQKWQFPEILSTAIRYHHNPAEAPHEYRKLIRVVTLGDRVAHLEDSQNAAEIKALEDYADTLEQGMLNGHKIGNWISIIDQEYDTVRQKLNFGS